MTIVKSSPESGVEWSPNPQAQTLSLPEQIAERIGNDIILGRYESGARIREQDEARSFKVSRGPVREALRILERDGLIQINARRGAQVTELTVAQLNDIFDPRIELNGLSARRATERQDLAAIAHFKVAVDRLSAMAAADDHAGYLNASYAANRAMCEASGNSFLNRLVFLLAHQALRYARLGLSTTKRRKHSAKNWRRLLSAMQSGDANVAETIAEELARDSRDAAVCLLTEQQRGEAQAVGEDAPATAPRSQARRSTKRS